MKDNMYKMLSIIADSLETYDGTIYQDSMGRCIVSCRKGEEVIALDYVVTSESIYKDLEKWENQ